MLCLAGVLVVQPAARVDATASGVTLTPSSASVAPGSKVTLTAATPVAGIGTISQEITQTIDPTKVKLTSLDDITYPTGWSLQFSTNGTSFSSTVPASAAAWAAVTAVRTSGAVVSQGASNGKQIAVGSSTQPLVPPGGSFSATSPGSDPWIVAFEDDGRVFVQIHHKYGGVGGLNNGAPYIKCFTRAAATCAGWSSTGYNPGGHTTPADFASGYDSMMWIDGPNNRLWFPTWGATASSSTGWKGFGCVDITPGAAPAPCSVSGLTSGYISFGSYTASVVDIVMGATGYDGRLFGFDVTTGSVLCANVSVAPFGPCWEGSWTNGMNTVPALSGSYTNTNGGPYWGVALKIIANKLWVFAKASSTGTPRIACLEPSTGAYCSGWSTSVGNVPGVADLSTKSNMGPVVIPNSSGAPVAVCGHGTSWACWTLAGASYTVPTNFATLIPQSGSAPREPITVGSKIYSSDGGGYVKCYDAVTDAACAGFPATGGLVVRGSVGMSLDHYTLEDDPLNPGCIWYASDAGVVGTLNAPTGGACVTAPARLIFGVETIVPRLGCSAAAAISSWGTLTLTSPSTSAYTSATVDVLKDGVVVDTRSLSSGTANYSDLSVATTGQTPTFRINFTGLTGSPATGAASITAIGDAPELCLTPTVQAVCPSGVGNVNPTTLLASSTTVTAAGTITPGGALTGDSETLTIQAPSISVCSGSLTGRAGTATLGTSGDALVGVTVSLLDSSGAAVLDASSNPITTTTDSSGNYSFTGLLPAAYKVRFASSGTTSQSASAALTSVTVSSGGSGTVATNTSNAATVPLQGSAVVDALYLAAAVARANTSTGTSGSVQTISVLADDTASSGATYSGGSTALKLCSTGQTSPNCTATSVSITGQGTYAVSGTNITFTPCSANNVPAGIGCTGAYGGTATAATYQSTDSLGRVASSTVTPTVVPPPTAASDAGNAAFDTNQTFTPTANDSAGSGATLVSIPTGICLNSVTAVASCTSTTLTVAGQGTYTLNTSTGVVTFDPLSTFTGTATPIKYVVADSLGQKSLGTITPTVIPPPAPVPTADTTSGTVGVAQTVTPFSNDSTPSGVTFTASSVKLCSSGQVSPNCTATSLSVAGQGNYSVNTSTGLVTFTPCSAVNVPAGASCTGAFTGAATPVTYQVTDSLSRVASSTYTPTVIPPPTAVADTGTGAWDTNQVFTPLSNDAAGSGTTLAAVPSGICVNTVTTASSCTSTSLTISNQGTYMLNTTTGEVTFDPLPTFTGTATAIKYAVADALGQKSLATITPSVMPPPAPVATAETKLVLPGSSVAFTTLTGSGGLATTGGPTFTTSATCLINTAVTPNTCVTSLTIAGEGTYTVNTGTGVVTFAASGSATPGLKTPVTYRVTDATGQTATSTLTPRIPDPPVARADSGYAEQGNALAFAVVSNDSASSPATLTATSVRLCPSAATTPYTTTNCNATTLVVSGQGTYSVDASTGVVTFTPCSAANVPAGASCSGAFTGAATAARYVVTDSLGQVANATITPNLLPPPATSAVNDIGSANFAQTVTFTPLTNDSAGSAPSSGYTTVGTASLAQATLKLCGTTESAPSCTLTTLTTVDGTYTVNPSNGQVAFEPAANFVGAATVPPRYMVCNEMGGTWAPLTPTTSCATATLTPTIQPPVAPVAVNDTSTGAYNTPQNILVLSNDTKDAALSLVASSVKLCGTSQSPPNCSLTSLTIAGEGTYVVNGNGSVTFTPVSTFSGTVATAPRYQVADSYGTIVNATITPTVTAPSAPVASPETKNVARGGSVAFTNVVGVSALATGSGLKTGASGGPCLVDPSDSVCKASVSISGQGTWGIDRVTGIPTFTALVNAPSGSQTAVTYRVTDAVGQTASSTLTPVVPPAGTGVNDSSYGAVDVNQQIFVVANDSPDTGATFTNSTLKLCGQSPVQTPAGCDKTSLAVSGEGTYTVNGDGSLTFDPLPTFTGAASAVRYQVTDSNSNTVDAYVSVVVTPAPIAADDASSAGYDVAQTISPMANDSASPGYSLGVVKLCGAGEVPNVCSQTTLNVAGEGTYTVNANGSVTFDPLPTFAGVATPVRYQAKDSLGQFVDALITPTVGTPAAPSATAESKTVVPGSSIDFTNVIGATALGSGTLLKTGVSGGPCLVDPSDSVCKTSFTIAGEGAWSIDQSTGIATFAALSTASPGSLTAVAYRITDGFGQVATSTLTPSIPPAPSAEDDTSTGKLDKDQTLTPLSNDTADALTPLVASTLKLCGAGQTPPSCDKASVTVVGEGTYTVNSDGSVTFDPLPTFFGAATPVRYQVADSAGRVADASLKPTVESIAAPTAKDDVSSGLWDVNQTFLPLSNDTADSTTPFEKTTLKLCGAGQTPTGCDKTSVIVAGEGTYTVNSDGSVTFDPLPSFSGSATFQRYQVADSIGRVADAILKASVAPPPVARPDSSQGEMGERQVVSLTGNDDAGAGNAPLDPASVRLCGTGEVAPACTKTQVTVAGEGTYSVNGNGTVDFVPESKFVGTATSLSYVVSDSLGQKATSTLTVSVVPPPAPIAVPDLAAGRQGETLVFSPWLNDSGGEIPVGVDGTVDVVRTSIRLCGDTERVPNCTQTTLTTADGTYTVDPKTGKVIFVHVPGFVGAVQSPPTYQIANDWKGASGSKIASSVLIPTILPPATPDSSPAALPDSSQGRKGKPQTIPVLGNDAVAATPFDTSSVKLCASGEVAPKCTATTLTVPGEGTYVVGKDGSVVFTPEAAFLGTATPQRYVVADKAGKTTSSTVTVRVLDQPVPAAVADTGRAKQGSKVELSPWLNDDAGGDGTELVPTSIRLCGPGESVPNCTKLRLATADGVYTVDPKSGKVTFVHKAGFTGEVTEPVSYQIANNYSGAAGPGFAVGVLKPTIITSDAKVLDQVNWTTPSTPVWLNPTSGGKPSKGSSFKLGTVRIKIGGNTFDVVNTSEGKWEVIRGLVRFTPKDGFVGRTKPIAFVVTDTEGATVGANLRVTVDPNLGKAGFLPATGAGLDPVWFGLLLLVCGVAMRRLRRFV